MKLDKKWWWIGIVILVWLVELIGKDDGPRLIVCNVGQGNGVMLIVGNWQTLFDVGPDNGMMASCLERYINWRDKEIEVVIISHWDLDHSGGLAQINKFYKIKNIFGPEPGIGNDEQKIYSKYLRADDVVRMGEYDFEVLSPDGFSHTLEGDENDNSVVGLLNYRDNKILIPGDVSEKVLKRLIWRDNLNLITEFVLAHHGSKTAMSKELLGLLRPAEVVISVGKNNYGHPNEEVLKIIGDLEIPIKRTDVVGDVVVEL